MENTNTVKNKGWQVTFAGTGALLALGVLYAWSIFKANIPIEWGWTETQQSLPYAVACVVFSVMTFVGARLLVRFGPRAIVSAGGVMAGLGVIISSFSSSPWIFTLAFGVLLGSGIGFVYGSAGPAALKWFPTSKTGLISGIVVAGFGMGSAWVAPLARALMESLGLQTTMLYLGIGMLIVVVGFAQFIKFPPKDFVLEEEDTVETSAKNSLIDFTVRETTRTWQFYVIWVAFAFGSGAGLMVIGNLASIVKDQIGLPTLTAIAVSALAIGNGGGRVLYGMLSDKIGRTNVLIIAFLVQALLISGLFFMGANSILANPPILLIFVALIGANYGANLAVFPALMKVFYGPKNLATNYGIAYTAWGLGGFMVSQLASTIKGATGSFDNAYILAAVMLILAAAMTLSLKSPQAKKAAADKLSMEAVAAD
ncbi:MAG: OFA family MFS transporter [Anaerolineae bacterium]|jgi:OFA family oxalate/formate antiporter-like MFS transporter|nr:OFA family MFS transporter [Anaerolineae bacterium]MBT4312297.1 OFA family MFS transporter [Anaerolineae bacterium]MBT4458798.1 OFA family MFS transporter [Anaerolineae bacterium]MBT4841255.1 OFA family MFS transporter [Anaerolineae bacterium]MBT6061568.1 OFA family MFS transporter [Anaerolineae bacterium]